MAIVCVFSLFYYAGSSSSKRDIMALKAKSKTKNLIALPKKSMIRVTSVASIYQSDEAHVLLDKQGRQIGYTKVSEEQGKTREDIEAITTAIIDASKNDSMLSLGCGCYVRCSVIEAIENHNGRDYKGLIIRGEGDVILGYLYAQDFEGRNQAAEILGDALISYENGDFFQAELVSLQG